MRKLLPTLLLVATGATLTHAASPTDWLNFAEAQDSNVLYSVQFANFGKLRFGNTAMTYEDEDGIKEIPYTVAGYMFFSAESQVSGDITSILGITECVPMLRYQAATQTVELTADDTASSITLYNMQGSVIGKAIDAKSLTVKAPKGTVVIAIAEYRSEALTNKFIVE